MNQKYEILKDQSIEINGQTLYRIRALMDIPARIPVNAGDIGGYVSNEHNLSQDGNCWIYHDAKVFDQSKLCNNACIFDHVELHDRSGMAGNSIARDHAKLFNRTRMWDSSLIRGNTELHSKVALRGNAYIRGGYLTESHHYMAFVNVGSENGTLHVFKTKTGINVHRGCFDGTVEEFLKAVQEKHGDNHFGQQYRALIEVAKLSILRTT